MKRVVYLDNAATTFPKPRAVSEAVAGCIERYGGNPGRASHRLAREAAETVFKCRCAVAEMFGSIEPERVVFTCSATSAINIAIKSKVRQGDHILIGDMEHNSVLRPVAELERRKIVSYSVFDTCGGDADGIITSIKSKLRPNTAILVCAHVSNVCGLTLPLEKIGELCAERKIHFIVDAAQSAGSHILDADRLHIGSLCMPGHKGLYGPMGTGVLIPSSADGTRTVVEGGSGVDSLNPYMPELLPERFEAGTLAVPAIAGLAEGVGFVRSMGEEHVGEYCSRLCDAFTERLLMIEGTTVYRLGHGSSVLFNIDGIGSESAAAMLDESFGIAVRAGLHCSPSAHKKLGTPAHGAVRASFGLFNTERDAEYAAEAVGTIAKLYRNRV